MSDDSELTPDDFREEPKPAPLSTPKTPTARKMARDPVTIIAVILLAVALIAQAVLMVIL